MTLQNNEPRYQVIKNPQNLFFKYEVWYAGEEETYDNRGMVHIGKVTRPVRALFSQKAADEFVQYQKEVFAFKHGGNSAA